MSTSERYTISMRYSEADGSPVTILTDDVNGVIYDIYLFKEKVEYWLRNELYCCYVGPAIRYPAIDLYEWWVDGEHLLTVKTKEAEVVMQWMEENQIDLSQPDGYMAFKLRWM